MPDLAWWIQNFERSAFRLETLPQYLVPQEVEMLARFRRGEEVRLSDDHAWLRLVSEARTVGKSMRRVRVVTSPLSDYLRFELSVYPQCVAAGEDIRVTERGLTGDFWLFDDGVAILLQYDSAGRFLGTSEGDAVSCRRTRDLALTDCMELSAYIARAAR